MLEALDHFEDAPSDRQRILRAFLAPPLAGVAGDRAQVAIWEERVAADPDTSFAFDQHGFACLGGRFAAGRFRTARLADLRSECHSERQGRLRLWVLDGSHPLTDIGALQACAAPDTLFQVASQFNCLEAPSPRIVPVANYLNDPTQGPRASISAFPGTLLRHYRAPDGQGGTFRQQSETPQLNLLRAVGAPVRNGYLLGQDIGRPDELIEHLEADFELLEVGVHEQTEVLLGANWVGPVRPGVRIAQVFTSTLAAGLYGNLGPELLPVCHHLLRAAYLGTLLAAASLRQRRVVLTMIGGGVFANPLPLIWESILWACSEVSHYLPQDLTVILNGRALAPTLSHQQLRQQARSRGGDLLICSPESIRFSEG